MKNSRVLTLKQLEKAGACEEQRDLFKRLFGESVEINLDIAKKYGKYFYVNWAAYNLLSTDSWCLYDYRIKKFHKTVKLYTYKTKCAIVFSELYILEDATLFERIQYHVTKLWKQFSS